MDIPQAYREGPEDELPAHGQPVTQAALHPHLSDMTVLGPGPNPASLIRFHPRRTSCDASP